MATALTTSRISSPHRSPAPDAGTRFDRRLSKILGYAVEVFYEKGYAGASMRDLSRASGMSLAGMYYYFKSKEQLLYLIQKHTFTTIMEQLRERLVEVSDPEQRVRVFVLNHIEYFLVNQKAMKVLSHEDDVLKNSLGADILSLKREYYRTCMQLMDALQKEKRLEFNSRVAVLSLFGMMNWIYTWYKPRVDGNAQTLARQMGDIFLSGVGTPQHTKARRTRKPN
jgi:TetR/AcrR family transcriptional regulator, cholesterol catabolism regulator